jgi:competence ComEA-like helix-hairpin-helix protein
MQDKLNLNDAEMDDLQDLEGVSDQVARSIISYRDEYGDFEDWDEVSEIPGVSSRTLKSLREHFSL